MIRIHKYHCYGNDFLIIWDGQVERAKLSEFCAAICRRHSGVGADGCVFLSSGREGRFVCRIFNSDGSEARLSGNGARCAAAFLHHQGIYREEAAVLETLAGDKTYRLIECGSSSWTFRSTLGAPDFSPRSIPFRGSPQPERVVGHQLEVEGLAVSVTAFSMGNPQCQVFVEDLPEGDLFQRLGSGLEKHPDFPDRTNVGFVKVEDRHRLRLKIWERGVGPTLSSGTGSCAAAVAAIVNGRAESPLSVRTESGQQEVEWRQGGEVQLTGKADFIAEVLYPWNAGSQ